MAKKYIATVMKRHFIGLDSFVYSSEYAIVGDYDEDTKIFTDRNGNEYAPMNNPHLMKSEVPYSYYNMIPLTELKQIVGEEMSLPDAIAEYEYMCKKNIYYAGFKVNDEPFFVLFNTDSMREAYEAAREVPKPDINDMNSSIAGDVSQIIESVVLGKYSLNELKYLVKSLKMDDEEIGRLIDTIELQIEATEKGESSVHLPNEEKERGKTDISDEVLEPIVPKKQPPKQNPPQKTPPKESPKKNPPKKSPEKKTPPQKPKPQPKPDIVVPDKKIIMPSEINIDEVFQKVTKTLIAQDRPALRVITELTRKEMDARKKKFGLLLTGPTGVGKTELMRLVARHLNRPFMKIDSTQITVPGYTGKDIEVYLWELYDKCGGDLEKAENAIVFFDEIDKKGSEKKSDVSGQGVLNLLLSFIEGTSYDATPNTQFKSRTVSISTNNMIVVFGGAFSDVYKHLLIKNGIGFESNISSSPQYKEAKKIDFIKYGQMTNEFMGRVSVIKLNDLTVEDIKRIMLESDESAMRIQKQIFQKLGVKLTFTDDFVNTIAEDAFAENSGARGINDIIDNATWEAFYKAYMKRGEYEEIILDKSTAYDSSSFQLIKKRSN